MEAGAAKPLGAAVAPSTSFHSRLPEAEIATTAPSPIGFVGSHEPSFSRTELLKEAKSHQILKRENYGWEGNLKYTQREFQ